MSSLLGSFDTADGVQQAVVPHSRRMGYDQDGTIIVSELSGGMEANGTPIAATQVYGYKLHSAVELADMNGESNSFSVNTVALSIPRVNVVAQKYGQHEVTLIFPEKRWVSTAFISVTDGSGIPWIVLPTETSDDAEWDEHTNTITGTFTETTNVPVNTNHTGSGAIELTHPHYLLLDELVNPVPVKAVRLRFRIGYDATHMTIAALHVYGPYRYGQEFGGTGTQFAEDRVVAFVYDDELEVWQDVALGQVNRDEVVYWDESELLNQPSALYAKNISVDRECVGVTIVTEGNVAGDIALSLDGVEWTEVLELGDLDAGDVVGPIHLRFSPTSSSTAGLRSGRLKLTVEEVN